MGGRCRTRRPRGVGEVEVRGRRRVGGRLFAGRAGEVRSATDYVCVVYSTLRGGCSCVRVRSPCGRRPSEALEHPDGRHRKSGVSVQVLKVRVSICRTVGIPVSRPRLQQGRAVHVTLKCRRTAKTRCLRALFLVPDIPAALRAPTCRAALPRAAPDGLLHQSRADHPWSARE